MMLEKRAKLSLLFSIYCFVILLILLHALLP